MIPLGFSLGIKDLVRGQSGLMTQVIAIAALLAPLLILYSLRYGVVSTLTDDLVSNPENRRIQTLRQGVYDQPFMDSLEADPRVDYLIPMATPIARSMDFSPDTGSTSTVVRGTILAAGPGDPLLPAGVLPPARGQIVLTPSMAQGLGVSIGGNAALWLGRTLEGRDETLVVPFTVIGLTDPAAWSSKGGLVDPDSNWQMEMWQEGYAAPTLGGHTGKSLPTIREYRNFRLYAKDLPSIEGLLSRLLADGVEARAPRLADYQAIMALNRVLGTIFLLLASTMTLGFLLSFGAAQWEAVARKRHAISILRLHGLGRFQSASMALTQAGAIALLGGALATVAYYAVAQMLNSVLTPIFKLGGDVSRLEPLHIAVAVGATLAAALLAASLAAARIARIEPGEGIRNA
jgi:putative ABC transport system permease protein